MNGMLRGGMVGVAAAIGLLVAGNAVAGTWTLQNSGGGGSATAVGIVDEDRAVAYGLAQQAGSDDAVPMWMKTPNGKDWTMTNANGKTAGELLMISTITCPKPALCLATATSVNMQTMAISNAVLKSTDGGLMFPWPPNQQWQNPSWSFANLDYVSDSVIWLSNGANVAATKAAPGGTWEYQWKVPQVGETRYLSILDIDFQDANVGYAVNGKENAETKAIEPEGALLKTTDGGATWQALYDGRAELPVDLQVLSPTLLYLSGRTAEGPFLRRSEDGGANWTELAIPAGADPKTWTGVDAYRAFDRDTAYVIVGVPVGQESYAHTIFEMRDGATLVEVLPNPANHQGGFVAMDCMGPNLCYAVGTDMMVVKYEGDGPLPGEDPGTVIPDAAMPDAVDPDGATVEDVPPQVDPGPFPFDDGYIPRDLAGGGGGGDGGGCTAGGAALPGVVAFGASMLALAALRIRGRRRG